MDNNLPMPKFYSVPESEADIIANPVKKGALILTDEGNIYFDDPVEGDRRPIAKDIVILQSESERASINPINNRMYCVFPLGTLYVYYNNKWYKLNKSGNINLFNIVVPAGTPSGDVEVDKLGSFLRVDMANVSEIDTGIFIPDLSVEDLTSNIKVKCFDGYVEIYVCDNSGSGVCLFDIPGNLYIDKSPYLSEAPPTT